MKNLGDHNRKSDTKKLDVFQYTRYSVPSAAIDHFPSFTKDFDSQPSSPFQTLPPSSLVTSMSTMDNPSNTLASLFLNLC